MEDVKTIVKQMIVERLKLRIDPDSIGDEQPLFGSDPAGLKLDSIDALDLAVCVLEKFNVEVPHDEMSVFGTVNRLAAFLQQKSAEALKAS